MFKFRCMHCDQKVAVPTEFAGRHVRCPGCAQATIVPFPSPEELEAAEEEGFHIRPAPWAALASRACKDCGATLPRTGPCLNCGFDPGATVRAAFDAARAAMVTVALPEAALPPPSRAQPTRGRTWAIVAAAFLLLAVAAWTYFLIGGNGSG